jgi:hypothetical protein
VSELSIEGSYRHVSGGIRRKLRHACSIGADSIDLRCSSGFNDFDKIASAASSVEGDQSIVTKVAVMVLGFVGPGLQDKERAEELTSAADEQTFLLSWLLSSR